MLTQPEEEALLRKAVAAGHLTSVDSELTPPRASTQEQPVFSVRIDYLVKLGRLSAETARALVQEVQQQTTGATLGSATEKTLDAPVAKPHLAATLDQTSDEAKAVLASSKNSFAFSQTVNNVSKGSSSSTSSSLLRFPVEHWDRYEFIKLLGQGGMGSVYKARDRQHGRIVALKFIRSGDAQMTARFLQEARTQSRCDHPGICKMYTEIPKNQAIMLSSDAGRSRLCCLVQNPRGGPTWAYGITVGSFQGALSYGRSDQAAEGRKVHWLVHQVLRQRRKASHQSQQTAYP